MNFELHALDRQLPESLKKYQEIVTLVNKFNALQPRCRKLLDEFFLFVGQLFGQLHIDADKKVAFVVAAHVWNALAGQAHFGFVFGTRRYF